MEGKDMFYTKLMDNAPKLEDLPDQNATRGFKRAVVNSQPTLALQYLRFMLSEHEEKLARLESEIKDLKEQAAVQQKTVAKKPAKSSKSTSPKSTKKKTQEPIEQEPAVDEMVEPINTKVPDDDVTDDDS